MYLEKNYDDYQEIVITNKSEQEVQIAKISESGIETSLDEILKSYSPIIEKIVVEQETIPYETITKDASQGATDKKNKVIQAGEDGIKEITYKVKYQNDEEIEKIKLSEQIIKEPVNKIVQDAILYAMDISTKKSVWFMISESYGKYYIIMFYDNEYNKANGEDL